MEESSKGDNTKEYIYLVVRQIKPVGVNPQEIRVSIWVEDKRDLRIPLPIKEKELPETSWRMSLRRLMGSRQ